jgi:putative SOS response-associated peptidase YedK
MCGRFGLSRPDKLDPRRFGVSAFPELPSHFNIAPGSDILAIRERKGERVADLLHWGLVPNWAKDPAIGNRMANARSDTAFEKPSFKRAILNRRCLIPADVFYEWQVVPGQRRKQPFAVRMKDGETFALGGIWDYWKASELSEGIVSCAILTTEPNTLLAPIHDRMPVIIPPDRYRAWLDPKTPAPAVRDLCQSFASDVMAAWPISLRINDPEEDGEEVIEPLAPTS